MTRRSIRNFDGSGRCVTTDADGHLPLPCRSSPAPIRGSNHHNAWRPNHIHLSACSAPAIATRLITQMYFPGDPLLALDPIFHGIPEGARERLISEFSIDVTESGYALGYIFNIVLRGRAQTPFEG